MSRLAIHQLRAVSVAETLASETSILDLWYNFYEGADTELPTAREASLTPDAHEQYSSFRFERDGRLYLAMRALVRSVLSNHATISPGDWRFAANEHGEPFVRAPIISPAAHFNLANTPGLVGVASVAHELFGGGAERIDRGVKVLEIADRHFSLSEPSRLRALPSPERPGLSLAYWSLKES